MRLLYDNISVAIIAASISVLAWLFGGTRSDVLANVVPWVLLFTLQVVVAFPQKRRGESTYDARDRVWEAMKGDPLVWTSLALIVLLTIPFVNNGLCTSCDRALIAQGLSPEPPVPFIPFCVDRIGHLNVFLWFAAALTTMVAVKHSLRRRGKRMLLKLVVWNGFALAVLGFVQVSTGAEGPLWMPVKNVAKASDFFSTFGYPNMAGDYFTTLFALSTALWRRSCDDFAANRHGSSGAGDTSHGKFWQKHIFLVPTAVFFFAAVNTLSRAAIMLSTLLLVVFFLHAFVSFTHRLARGEKVRKGAIAIAVVSAAAFFAIEFLPEDMQREVDTISTDAVLTRVTGKGQYHTRVATELWKDHPLFGCGGWGYKHFCISKMTPEELRNLQKIGGINVHNDYLQFLAEHGLVGFGAMVAIVVMLLLPVARSWKELAVAARFTESRRAPPKPTALFALPAPAFCILAGAVATLVHCFGDCPMRSAAVMSLFFASLAAIPGFLPKQEEHKDASR